MKAKFTHIHTPSSDTQTRAWSTANPTDLNAEYGQATRHVPNPTRLAALRRLAFPNRVQSSPAEVLAASVHPEPFDMPEENLGYLD